MPATKRVLIVEDEPLIAMDLVATIEDGGFEVAGVAHDAQKALALAQKGNFEVAVLDVVLGPGDSLAIAEFLEERRIPIVFTTGAEVIDLPERWRQTPLISKPFDTNALLQLLREALEPDGSAA